MSWYTRSCPVCAGDVYDDFLEAGWVTCVVCARSFVATDLVRVQRVGDRPVTDLERVTTAELLAS